MAGGAQATNGYYLEGYGTRVKAQAGVGIALPQDALTVATNPAGLVDVDDGLSVGLEWFRPRRGAQLVQGGAAANFDGNGTPNFLLPEIGYSHRLSERWSWGIALYGNGGLETNYAANPFGRFGAQGTAGVGLQQAFLTPAIAWRINDANAVGVALNVGFQRFKAQGIGLFSAFSADPANVSNRGNEDSTGLGVRVGWTGRVGEHVSLGATWQSKTRFGEFRKYAGLFADHGSFDAPETYGLGIALRPSKAATIELDWQRILYADIPPVGNPLAALLRGVPLGAANGPGFGWRNVSIVKLGGSYELSGNFTLRAGVSRARQPIPASETFFNILAPGVIETHLTLGGTWRLSDRDAIDVALLHAPKVTVNGSGSIPASFGGGEANIHLQENALTVSWSHRFQ
jgi:long-chain fatty acid transport protein